MGYSGKGKRGRLMVVVLLLLLPACPPACLHPSIPRRPTLCFNPVLLTRLWRVPSPALTLLQACLA